MDRRIIEDRFIFAKRALFDKAYGEFLNPEQRDAVFTADGPLLVLAGAGSGKTTVLVNRVSYLIKYGNAYFSEDVPEEVDEDTVLALESALSLSASDIQDILPQFISSPCPPWSVLAITFTNKAAGEIKDRLLKNFEDESVAHSIWAGTFHSVCLRILRKFGDRLGLREGFSVYDQDSTKHLVTDCMKELHIPEKFLSAKAVAGIISRAKDRLETPDGMELDRDPRLRDVREIYRLYQEKLLFNNAVDFDDIIMMTVSLLRDHEDIHEYYNNKFKYILVDEYQDTNYAQFMLTRLLAEKRRNIMVVGDDDQSIYRFRGATIENILNFDKTYPDAKVVKLEQNYRSTSNILAAANAIISNNTERHSKKLWSAKGEGARIMIKEAEDQNDEGRFIISRIIKAVKEEGKSYSDFAVLYRTNALGRSLQTSFVKSAIPFRVFGDLKFYSRKEIKDMLAYLGVLAKDRDGQKLKRIINEPKRKIGATTVDAIEEISNSLNIPMYEVVEHADEYPALAKSKDKLREFSELIAKVREASKLPSELIRSIFEASGYREMLELEGIEGRAKIENIEELISAALEYEKRVEDSDEEATVVGFLEEMSLIGGVDKYDESSDTVVLMTVHAAKGLEFPVVFLAGMEDGIFPSLRDDDDGGDISEERRLAYVAITRARERLYISYAKGRMLYGRTMFGSLSRFIQNELPESLTERDVPKREPPRKSYYSGSLGYERAESRASRQEPRPYYKELERKPEIGMSDKKRGAEKFGLEKLPAGTRVRHPMFGDGVILSSRDVGGDVLYEVSFDNGDKKKLMATFARLQKL